MTVIHDNSEDSMIQISLNSNCWSAGHVLKMVKAEIEIYVKGLWEVVGSIRDGAWCGRGDLLPGTRRFRYGGRGGRASIFWGGYQYFQGPWKDGWGPWDGRPSRMGSGLNWAAKVVPGKNLLKFQSKNNFLFISEHFPMFHTIRYKSPRLNLTQKVEYSGKIWLCCLQSRFLQRGI